MEGKQKSDVKIRSYYFSLKIIKLINTLPEKRLFWTIGDQLLRSSMSVGANIVEAKSSSTKKEFTRYFQISLKSANESKYWLCLLRDGSNTDKQKINLLLEELNEISNMLGASIITLKKSLKK